MGRFEFASVLERSDSHPSIAVDFNGRSKLALHEEAALAVPSDRQRELLDSLVRGLAADRQVRAVWLAGSLARCDGDAFSDVDVIALVTGRDAGQVGARYAAGARRVGSSSLVRSKMDNRVVNVITGSWDRFDLRFVSEAELPKIRSMTLLPLWGDTDVLTGPVGEADRAASPEAVVQLVCEFFRVLGLAVVVVHREEWLLAQAGISMMKQLTIDLLLESSGVSPSQRGGALRLNALLPRAQRLALEALPVPSIDRADIIAANVAVARLFVPLARELVARVAGEWPTAFEVATRRHLREQLGVEIGA